MADRFSFRDVLLGPLRRPIDRFRAIVQNGWSPRPGVASRRLIVPFEWSAGGDANLDFQLNAWKPLDVVLTYFDIERDETALYLALDLITDWQLNIGNTQRSGAVNQDMAVALRSLKLSYLITQPELDTVRLRELTALATSHLERLLIEPTKITNHALFQIHAVMAAGRAGLTADQIDLIDCAAIRMKEFVRGQFTPDGIHKEHSPEYHHLVTHNLLKSLSTGWYKGHPEIRSVASRAKSNFCWFADPNGNLPAIGDSERKPIPVRGVEPMLGVNTSVLGSGDYAVVKSDSKASTGAYLILTAAQHSLTHKHNDNLSFEYHDRGEPVIIDSGKYTYKKGPWRDYFIGASAHNSLEFYSEGDAVPVENSEVVSIVDTGGTIIISAQSEGEYGEHRRFLYLRPGEWLVIIDRVVVRKDGDIKGFLHFSPNIHLKPVAGGFSDGVVTVSQRSSRKFSNVKCIRGTTVPKIQGWASDTYESKHPCDCVEFLAHIPPGSTSFTTSLGIGGIMPPSIVLGLDAVVIRLADATVFETSLERF